MRSKVYMLVSHDKYELPLIVCDTAEELAQKLGTSRNAVDSAISNAKKRGYRCQYVRVTIDDEN